MKVQANTIIKGTSISWKKMVKKIFRVFMIELAKNKIVEIWEI